MPLNNGKSKKAIGQNIKTEEQAGKPRKQAIAIALNKADKGRKEKELTMETGWLIEYDHNGIPAWLEGFYEQVTNFSTESTEAIRFLRKEDAEQLIAKSVLKYAQHLSVTEHQWG